MLIDCLAQSTGGTEVALQERLKDTGIAKQDSGEAWFIIAGFVVFGITSCFGAFLKPMGADLHAGRGATSALFSITSVAFYMRHSPGTSATASGRASWWASAQSSWGWV